MKKVLPIILIMLISGSFLYASYDKEYDDCCDYCDEQLEGEIYFFSQINLICERKNEDCDDSLLRDMIENPEKYTQPCYNYCYEKYFGSDSNDKKPFGCFLKIISQTP